MTQLYLRATRGLGFLASGLPEDVSGSEPSLPPPQDTHSQPPGAASALGVGAGGARGGGNRCAAGVTGMGGRALLSPSRVRPGPQGPPLPGGLAVIKEVPGTLGTVRGSWGTEGVVPAELRGWGQQTSSGRGPCGPHWGGVGFSLVCWRVA